MDNFLYTKDYTQIFDDFIHLSLIHIFLATNGMLVKRPLIIGDEFVLVGFKEAE